MTQEAAVELVRLQELHERLRSAYQDLEGRHEALRATTSVSIEALESVRKELVVWSASEAARWLDPRAGSGPANPHGQKLQQLAAVIARDQEQIARLQGEVERRDAALKRALPFLINDSPGGCTGQYSHCEHCVVIRLVKAMLAAAPSALPAKSEGEVDEPQRVAMLEDNHR